MTHDPPNPDPPIADCDCTWCAFVRASEQRVADLESWIRAEEQRQQRERDEAHGATWSTFRTTSALQVEVRRLQRELQAARAVAYTLAYAYRAALRPPPGAVRDALAWEKHARTRTPESP